jgi:2-amino-4-hydroxy-6-hydroxymethyldihydropteridine diphosphokinase
MNPVIAYIALGSNLGVRWQNIDLAVKSLRTIPRIEIVKVSSNFDNPSSGGPADSPRYLNAAAEVRTTLDPLTLIRTLLAIEAQMGRVRIKRNEPRIIDLDLLLYGDQIISTPELTVPHPRMHEREFVLKPMEEIAFNLKHPVLQSTMHELLVALYR